MGEAMIAYGRAEIASFLFETGEVDIEFERAPSPTEQVDQVDVVDLLLVNA